MTANTTGFQIVGDNANALFTLKAHRGEGMLLLAMNWKKGQPPRDFVGFSIEYMVPGGNKFYSLKNRISFPDKNGNVSKESISSLQAPFQKFRWIHFPQNAGMDGDFIYKVKPVFMDSKQALSYGESQQIAIQLSRETYPKQLNVAFTRGFISSQAFVDRYGAGDGISALLPSEAKDGLEFKPTHPKADEALEWMGFEAVKSVIELLDKAIDDENAEVKVVAYDLNQPEVLSRLKKLGKRLQVIIDDSGSHDDADSAETKAYNILSKSTGGNAKRQHMGQLQHNKTIVVNGPKVKAAVCGSTNFTWRGFYVQSNNAVIVYGANAIKPFLESFDNYWKFDKVKDFGGTTSADWNDLSLKEIDGKISFSPHAENNALLNVIAKDLEKNTVSNIFYSLAFLYQTEGPLKDTIVKLTNTSKYFIYGISDKKVGGFDLQKPNGNLDPVYPSEISKSLPEPFKSEPTGGTGTRMHHKFIVIDFDKPTARVYLGSYNFSPTADRKNGENLLLIRDQRVAVSYMIEALRIFDHYHFRVTQKTTGKAKKVVALSLPPANDTEKPWWDEYYTNKIKIKDRELFA